MANQHKKKTRLVKKKIRSPEKGLSFRFYSFGSAAGNLNIHSLVIDGVYRLRGGKPTFQYVAAPTTEEMALLVERIACGQKTHLYCDINILTFIVRVTMPLYLASKETYN